MTWARSGRQSQGAAGPGVRTQQDGGTAGGGGWGGGGGVGGPEHWSHFVWLVTWAMIKICCTVSRFHPSFIPVPCEGRRFHFIKPPSGAFEARDRVGQRSVSLASAALSSETRLLSP